MPRHILITLRLVAATLVVCAGIVRVSSLWFRELDEQAVLALLTGAVYLIIGIGLFGQSRFVLFVATLTCAATSLLTVRYFSLAELLPLQQAGVVGDAVTALICTVVLWQLRREPSI